MGSIETIGTIGNPLGLLRNAVSGLEDCFCLPIKGIK
jgi:hypothetical protein